MRERLGRHDYVMIQTFVFSGLLHGNPGASVSNALELGDKFVAALEARLDAREDAELAAREAEDEHGR